MKVTITASQCLACRRNDTQGTLARQKVDIGLLKLNCFCLHGNLIKRCLAVNINIHLTTLAEPLLLRAYVITVKRIAARLLNVFNQHCPRKTKTIAVIIIIVSAKINVMKMEMLQTKIMYELSSYS